MPITPTVELLDNGTSFIHEHYYGEVSSLDIFHSLATTITESANEKLTLVASDWTKVTHISFQDHDVLSASGAANSLNLEDRNLCIAFILGKNDRLHKLANNFRNSIVNRHIDINISDDLPDGLAWLMEKSTSKSDA